MKDPSCNLSRTSSADRVYMKYVLGRERSVHAYRILPALGSSFIFLGRQYTHLWSICNLDGNEVLQDKDPSLSRFCEQSHSSKQWGKK